MKLTDAVRIAAEEHAAQCHPKESCGLVVRTESGEQYHACNNKAADKLEHFVIDPDDYAAAEELGEVLAVIHSHPNASPNPSQADLVSCEASGLPWFIVGYPTLKWCAFEPSGYKAPLEQREFSHGVLDCYALVKDFYQEQFGIELPEYERQGEWWKHGQNLYMDNLAAGGFDIVQGPPQYGDMLLIQIKANVPNHAAIYVGDGRILHHLIHRLSKVDIYGGYYQKHTVAVCRYRAGLKNGQAAG